MQRIHRVKKDYGMPDYYDFYDRSYNHKLDRKEYNSIITDFNDGILQLIVEDNLKFKMPYTGFEIFVAKFRKRPRLKDGKLINTVPINWKETLQLWEKDGEAKEKKLLVRYTNSHTSGYIFKVYCKKFGCRLKYRSLYKFRANRKLQRALSKRIKDPNKDNFDAFLLYKN